jgi:ATP-dependent metalloprotease
LGGASRNRLAQLEETANRNPNSATAQNAFYQALLRADMPAIVVERHQTGSFATSTATEAAYQKALGLLQQVEGNTAGGHFTGQTGNYNAAQIQASKWSLVLYSAFSSHASLCWSF